MKKIEKLTLDQERKMIAFREEWIKTGLSTARIDKEKTKECISKMYELIGKKPPVFIFCPSLAFAKVQISYCMEVLPEIFSVENKKKIGDNLWDNLWDNLRANLRDNLWDNLGANLGANLRDNLWANLGANLGANLWDNLWANLDKIDNYPFSGSMEAFWIAFYEFPEKFLGVKYKPEDSERLKIWSDLAKSSSWFWTYENYCFVSDRPKQITFNSEALLHNTKEAAIEWIDGYKIHYVNGREISGELFNKVVSESFSFSDFKKIENEDEKGIIMTIIKENKGSDGLLKFLGATEIDKKVIHHTKEYSETIRLFRTKEKYSFLQNSKGETNQPYAWIEMVCPSTGTTYLIDTCPTFTDAVECAKWHRPKQIPASLKYNWLSAN